MQKTNLQKYVPIALGALIGLIILVTLTYVFDYEDKIISYLGGGNKESVMGDDASNADGSNSDLDDFEDEIQFNPRQLSAGGDNWTMSFIETQPDVFSGKILYDNGKKSLTLTALLSGQSLTGESKTDNGNIPVKISYENKECTDSDGNIFSHSFKIQIDKKSETGCGGNNLKLNKTE